MTVMYEDGRQQRFARAGFLTPPTDKTLILDSLRFWQLTGEGWKFVIGEEGEVIAYLPPKVEDRLNALAEESRLQRFMKRKKKR